MYSEVCLPPFDILRSLRSFQGSFCGYLQASFRLFLPCGQGYLKKDEGAADILEEPYAEESQIRHVVINVRTNSIVKNEETVNKIVNGEKANIAVTRVTETELKETEGLVSPAREEGTVSVTSESESAVQEDERELQLKSELESAVSEKEASVLRLESESAVRVKQTERVVEQESESSVKEENTESFSDSKSGVEESKKK
ncbi:uncharacterized protein [Macrobrachium rosenbergii]|uniref:uncharacterized protein n=1 Tax=Macrobrachium rosenbergii TaxID=79674 RepID=UPI0034D514C0